MLSVLLHCPELVTDTHKLNKGFTTRPAWSVWITIVDRGPGEDTTWDHIEESRVDCKTIVLI